MIKFECVTELSELQCLFPGEPFCDNARYAAYKTEYGGNDFSLLFSLNGNICILERIKSDKTSRPLPTDCFVRRSILLFAAVLIRRFAAFLSFRMSLFLSVLRKKTESFREIRPNFCREAAVNIDNVGLK